MLNKITQKLHTEAQTHSPVAKSPSRSRSAVELVAIGAASPKETLQLSSPTSDPADGGPGSTGETNTAKEAASTDNPEGAATGQSVVVFHGHPE